jgi:hypothetical protein
MLAPDQLVMQFQSLGDNCEFGIVQRRCGAEPLGLARFAAFHHPQLLSALSRKLADFGEDIEIVIGNVETGGTEFHARDRTYGLHYHTGHTTASFTATEMLERERVRMGFLKRKFLEDLERAATIWVIKRNDPLPLATVEKVFSLLRGFGPNTLLWAVAANDEHPPGSVETLEAGLLKGYVARFAPYDRATEVHTESWLELCRNAYRSVRPQGETNVRA